jgi:hypothetical protein
LFVVKNGEVWKEHIVKLCGLQKVMESGWNAGNERW